MSSFSSFLSLSFIVVACSGTAVLGNGDDESESPPLVSTPDGTIGRSGGAPNAGGSGTTATGGASQVLFDTNPRPADCTTPSGWEDATTLDGKILFEPIEVFRGYVVGPRWPLPESDDQVQVLIKERTETTITGAVIFGSDELPPKATDPLTGYLPEGKDVWSDASHETGDYYWRYALLPSVWSGYALTLSDGTIDGVRVRFAISAAEQWRTWCELVAGYPNGMCVPSEQGDPAACAEAGLATENCEVCVIAGVHYDCMKFSLCTSSNLASRSVCSCAGCGCTASREAATLTFDLRLEQGQLNGTVQQWFPDTGFYAYLEPVQPQ
jgi:hypothetical protein